MSQAHSDNKCLLYQVCAMQVNLSRQACFEHHDCGGSTQRVFGRQTTKHHSRQSWAHTEFYTRTRAKQLCSTTGPHCNRELNVHCAKPVAFKVDEGAAPIETEVGLAFDDWMLPEPVHTLTPSMRLVTLTCKHQQTLYVQHSQLFLQ